MGVLQVPRQKGGYAPGGVRGRTKAEHPTAATTATGKAPAISILSLSPRLLASYYRRAKKVRGRGSAECGFFVRCYCTRVLSEESDIWSDSVNNLCVFSLLPRAEGLVCFHEVRWAECACRRGRLHCGILPHTHIPLSRTAGLEYVEMVAGEVR